MATSHLFTPIKLRDLELWNRIVVAPMCQYSAVDGTMTDWHMQHVGSLANSGAALVIVEATGVELEGRISHGCTALVNDANEAAMKKVVDACKSFGTAAIGIQLGHAGRKASAQKPWEGGTSLKENPWQTKSASAVPYDDGWHTPHGMTLDEITKLKAAFVEATIRADRAGFDLIEIHGAHGYLLNQFLSPLSNQRNDQYGGSLENRCRLPLEIYTEMRKALSPGKPLGIRISAVEWVDGGITLADSIAFSKMLKAAGCDFVDVSSGGNSPKQKIELKAGYQVPFAAAIRKEAGIPVMAVGLITDPAHAEAIVADGEADMVALARGFMDDLRWGWHAAWALGVEPRMAPQHRRIGPRSWSPAKKYQDAKSAS
jgi:2,4-dienoyl-CoA reductase-like NADH-dependent reductase (Old Yellow Enzyme family)